MTFDEPEVPGGMGASHPARVYDWLLGGKDHYEIDEAVGRKLPRIAHDSARQNRAFMHRAATWAARRGIAQFLDIGTGIPTEPNLHQVVQEVNPAARVVYTDNDPIVLRHAEALLISTPQGSTDYVEADVRQPASILEHARGKLDFGRPIALSLIALMHFVPDADDPYGIVRTLTGALAPGSALLLSHGTADFHRELEGEVTGTYRSGGITLVPRTHAEVARFFDGLDVVPPGVVRAVEWYQEEPAPVDEPTPLYVGAGLVR
ncbi:SAM-dependent methyltransferase [Streptomyces sp. NPDC050560]|uniref:SAM-dependent methyltransferase n=1 Tax=Streptomyces sp. NPDC050560 TaxID=3365630 RepID=UPI0037BCE0F2